MNKASFRRNNSFLNADLLPVKVKTLLTVGLVTLASTNIMGQRINLSVKNEPVISVLQQIETQSGYSFIYDSSILHQGNLDLILREENIESALAKIFSEANFDYAITNKTVTLTKKKSQKQENIFVNGRVLVDDLDGTKPYPVPGVSITARSVNKSVTTNNVGDFRIEVPKDSEVKISYLGYVSQELSAQNLANVGTIILKKSENSLDEVIITGYGKKEARENQTGSAYTITAKDLANRPALRLDALLEGIVPGVEFQTQDAGTNSSARPRYSTRVRGEGSAIGGATSNEPLWIIDGIPLYTGGTTNSIPGTEASISPLTYMDMNDIESVTVLKDASATTIYGANGSNGVILITTKQGKGAAKVNYTFRTGVNQRSKTNFRFLDGPQYLSVLKRMGMDDQLGNIDPNVNTYWPDYYFRKGNTTLHNVDVSGSTGTTSYYLSASMYNEEMTTIGNSTKRYSIRTNLNSSIGKALTIQGGLTGSFNVNDLFNPSNAFFEYSPLISPVGPDGGYIERDPNGSLLQYMPGLADQNEHNQKAIWLKANLGFTLRILDGLNFVNRNGADISSVNENRYSSMYNYTGASSKGIAYRNQSQVVNVISTNTLGYNKDLFGGVFDVLIGTEARQMDRNSVSAQGSGFPNDNIREVNFVSETNRRGTGSRAKETLLSYFGRAGYVYDKRYSLDFTYRKDGSSNFGKDVKWGNFSSIGAAWTVSNEDFWKENDIIDFLKFKASYGNNGNSRFSSSYAKGIYNYTEDNNYGNNSGAIMSRGVNNDLKWETTKMFNTGIDFRLFDRVSVAAEYYKNVTHDLIDDSYTSMLSGFRRVYQNVGKVQNSGFELVVNSDNISNKKFKWNTNFILSLNKNKVLELSEGIDRVSGNSIMREGYNSRSFYMIRWAGVDPSTGDAMWYDNNGNITKVYDTNNRVIVGNPNPDFYGGMTNTFSYDNFSLSVFLKYNKGGYTFDQMGRNIGQDGLNILSGNQSINVLNAWYLPGYLASEPRLSNISNNSIMNSTRYLMDKTYLSLDNVALSYRLPENFTKRLRISSVMLTAMASKLAIWTPYSGKKGTARMFENLEGFEFLKDTKYLYNTYAEMFDSNSRIANYSFSVSVRF